MKHLKHGIPSGREQAVSGTPHQAEEHGLNLIGLNWRGNPQNFNRDLPCSIFSCHEKIHGLMYHSDPPKVFFVKQICANPINNNMLSSVHILQHFSLHICYPKRPISRPKHDLIPKTHAPVFFGTCPKTKLLRRPGWIKSYPPAFFGTCPKAKWLRRQGDWIPSYPRDCFCPSINVESTCVPALSNFRQRSAWHCEKVSEITFKLYQHHCKSNMLGRRVRLSGDNIVKTWESMAMIKLFVKNNEKLSLLSSTNCAWSIATVLRCWSSSCSTWVLKKCLQC